MTQKPQKMTQKTFDNDDVIQRMTADKNAKKARTEEAKSSKESEEQLKQDKAALEKERLKREKQFNSDNDDENVAQQGEGPSVNKEVIRKQSSSSGGNSRPSMNRRSWICPICTSINDPAVSHCARSMMLLSSNGRKVSLRYLFEDNNRNNGEVRVASRHMINYNMMTQLSQNKSSSNDGDKDTFERTVINTATYFQHAAKKLLKDDEKYRTLDTTNAKVEEQLLGYEGVIDFLLLLGFDSDVMG
ncbi:hypothetical protein RFI_25948 [Reticulomyxa filosa]|uniref:Uncharacterized protein n=1 Tax=Reticulomyxa filosa TaxID=46433 RepID=X6MDD4_RETFI|nr:hypothetical protein RFI_25948 [Reticulomyxa filosa]|eukprot:ETO11427.1 hypothetical protein RFI_25948 [Reticulomyxa filosa]